MRDQESGERVLCGISKYKQDSPGNEGNNIQQTLLYEMVHAKTSVSRKGRGNTPHLAQKEATKQPVRKQMYAVDTPNIVAR